MTDDAVSNPAHYTYIGEKIADQGVIDADLIEVRHILTAAFEDQPYLWNAGKYLFRAGRKDDAVEDLRKAKQYIDFQLELRAQYDADRERIFEYDTLDIKEES